MNPRIALRSALSECRQYRGDTKEHLKACYEEVMQEPEKDWPWWVAYFQGEADKFKAVGHFKTADEAKGVR
jgi:hypothetical protein